jgi:hypothetical protein
MSEGLDPPCLELGDTPEHKLLTWAGRKTDKRDLVLMREDKAHYRANREVPGSGPETFTHLEDGGWIERVTIGESFRWRILVFCSCGGEDRLFLGAADGSVVTMPFGRSNGATPPLLPVRLLPVTNANGGMERSAQKSTVYLATYFFPQVVRGAGIQMTPLQINGAALAHHLNRWKLQGVDLLTMKRMMEEFAKHPAWCRNARRPPWRVFVGKREDLASLVASNQRRHPGNNRNKDWLAYPSRRTTFAVT